MQAQISSENLEFLVSGQPLQPSISSSLQPSISSSPEPLQPSISSSPQPLKPSSNYFELKNQIDKDTFHIGC